MKLILDIFKKKKVPVGLPEIFDPKPGDRYTVGGPTSAHALKTLLEAQSGKTVIGHVEYDKCGRATVVVDKVKE